LLKLDLCIDVAPLQIINEPCFKSTIIIIKVNHKFFYVNLALLHIRLQISKRKPHSKSKRRRIYKKTTASS